MKGIVNRDLKEKTIWWPTEMQGKDNSNLLHEPNKAVIADKP